MLGASNGQASDSTVYMIDTIPSLLLYKQYVYVVDTTGVNPAPQLDFIKLIANINYPEIDSIVSIIVSLGSTAGGGELLVKNFYFDNDSDLSPPLSYSRDGFRFLLCLGHFTSITEYHCMVNFRFLDGSLSQTMEYHYSP